MATNSKRIAAFDIGTVTCRLLLAEVQDGVLHELERRCVITNLGVGVDKTGILQEDAIQRVVAQIGEYIEIVNSYRTEQQPEIPIVAVATSASRDAKNSDDLVGKLHDLGVELSVIEGEREAALSFRGASRGHEGENLLVADIGGGSTEVVLGVGGEAPKLAHSFNVGCRRMTERFYVSDPPAELELAQARIWVQREFKPFFEHAKNKGIAIDRIVSMDKKMEVYDSSLVDGVTVSSETLDCLYRQLSSMPLADRKHVVGLQPERASVIVAGLGILLEVLAAADCKSFTVSESDILQGLILGAYEQGK